MVQGSEDGLLYYVRFANCNRRLDRWVDLAWLRPLQAVRVFDSSIINASAFAAAAGLPLSVLHPQSTKLDKGSPGIAHSVFARRNTGTRKTLARLNVSADEPASSNYERCYQERAAVKNVCKVAFDGLLFEVWHFSPFPWLKGVAEALFFCAGCFFYCRSAAGLTLHEANCDFRQPPGRKVYADDALALEVFEVDGAAAKTFCQCLCLFGKLFLERKTLFYDVGLFRFFVALRAERGRLRPLGFFSKEKCSLDHNNLSCIVVFPHWQRRGVGRFLVELSYAVSRKEKVVAGPENPISDLGRLLYNAFWTEEVLRAIDALNKNVCTAELSDFTLIPEVYVVSVLDALDLLRYFKGQYVVPFDKKVIQKYLAFFKKPQKLPFKADCLLNKL